ncbi:MAG: hypothetical protein HOQ05_00440, partial [Corynebacteriales bacterium]|nr:hypothetical protein [Mycobacteriales bacterium]
MQSRVRVALVAWVVLLLIIGGYGLIPAALESAELRAVRTAQDDIYRPTARLVTALQEERHLSVQLIGRNDSSHATLWSQRKKTDRAINDFRDTEGSTIAKDSDVLARRITSTLSALENLEDGRAAIDAGSSTRSDAASAYTSLIEATFPVFEAMPASDEPEVTKSQGILAAVQRFREIHARENTLLAGAMAQGQLIPSDYQQFNELVSIRRFLITDLASGLSGDKLRAFNGVIQSGSFTSIQGFEDQIINQDSTDGDIPIANNDWSSAGTGAFTELTDLESDFANDMLEKSDSEATSVLVNATLVTLAVLLVGLILTIVWFRVAPRHVLRELTALKESALDFALNRLPNVVGKLQRGERVDVQAEVPPLESSKDEFGDVSRAFNSVRQVAVQAAVDQAALRNGIRDVFVNLARRSQGLVHRQLSLLDKMEREANDPEELEKLFAIDHLATRLRRHAEDLIILSGSAPGRQWRKPVSMINVIRSAVGEIEAYNRVSVLQIDEAHLSGRIVADVIPLLSALIDNATTYSPPQTKVRVVGAAVPNGFVVEIEDSGLGMTDEELSRFNRQLAKRPEFNLSDTVQLGLFVVAHLAHRHEINVALRRSPYGGTTAIVLIPSTLLDTENAPEDNAPPTDLPTRRRDVSSDTQESATPNVPAARPEPANKP